MYSIICKNCSTQNDSDKEFCLSCGAYINKEFFAITNVDISNKLIDERYSLLDKNTLLVKDTIFGKPNFGGNIINDESLFNLYQKYEKYDFFPKVYDAFSFEDNDYLIVESNKDLYGQEYRNINEALVEITNRERVQLIRDSAVIYDLTQFDSIEQSLLEPTNFFVDEDLNIKLKLIKNNKSNISLKNFGEMWKKMLIPSEMSFLEYSKYKVGELLKLIIDEKVTNIKDVIKKLDAILENNFVELDYYSISDIGQKRENNEDNFFSTTININEKSISRIDKNQKGLFIICDGMGGHEKGELASKIAIEKIKKTILPALSFKLGFDEIKKLFEEAIVYQANDSIFKENQEQGNEYEQRMGTTVIVTIVIDGSIYTGHVGDSRIYSVNKSIIEQITQDHNVAMQNYNEGKGSWNDALRNTSTSWGKMLSQALGIRDNNEILPEVNFLQVRDESYILMCSDGLSDLVNEDEIKNIIAINWDNTKAAVETLVNKANEYGGRDNITVTLIKIKNLSNFLPPADYASIYYSYETELNEELIEMTEMDQKNLEGLFVEPDL